MAYMLAKIYIQNIDYLKTTILAPGAEESWQHCVKFRFNVTSYLRAD